MPDNASAAIVFARNPSVDTCYLTTDSQGFVSENLAAVHAAELGDFTVDTYERESCTDEIAAELANMKRESGLVKARASLAVATADGEASAIETYQDELAEALGEAELVGIEDPIVLSGDIVLKRSRAVIGAYAASGMTLAAWAAQDVPTKEAAVIAYINSLP